MKKTKEALSNNQGFSLMELIIVLAIVAVLTGIVSMVFGKYLEKSRESADIANVRNVYTEIMAAIISDENDMSGYYDSSTGEYQAKVKLTQKQDGWQSRGELVVGDISSLSSAGKNWIGSPKAEGNAVVYSKNKVDIIIMWDENATISKGEAFSFEAGKEFSADTLNASTGDGSFSNCASSVGTSFKAGDSFTVKALDSSASLNQFGIILYNYNGVLYNSGKVTGSWGVVSSEGVNGERLEDIVSISTNSKTGDTTYTFKQNCSMAVNLYFKSSSDIEAFKANSVSKIEYNVN